MSGIELFSASATPASLQNFLGALLRNAVGVWQASCYHYRELLHQKSTEVSRFHRGQDSTWTQISRNPHCISFSLTFLVLRGHETVNFTKLSIVVRLNAKTTTPAKDRLPIEPVRVGNVDDNTARRKRKRFAWPLSVRSWGEGCVWRPCNIESGWPPRKQIIGIRLWM
jgi:hypothetical protein